MNALSSPTIADVARLAGVSTATVSRVLNNSPLVMPETALRVSSAMAELRYAPRAAARMLASRKTNTIGLLLPEISGDFFQPMLRGIEKATRQAGYDLFIHTTQTRPDGPPRQPGRSEAQNTDGLIVFTGSLDDRELARLHALDFPLVLMHQPSPAGLHIPMVTVENKEGARLLVQHLVQVHHRQSIVFLRGPQHHDDSMWRERGYLEALQAEGIPLDPELIAFGGFDREVAAQTLRGLLESGLDFDAVFSGDDESAVGVLRALQAAGRRVPQDVAVVGFDDIPLAAYLSPPLTTVHAPIEQVGQQAVELLIARIYGKSLSAAPSLLPTHMLPVQVLLPTQLIIRQSCGCR